MLVCTVKVLRKPCLLYANCPKQLIHKGCESSTLLEKSTHCIFIHSFLLLHLFALVVGQLFSLVMQVCFRVSDMKKICSGEEEEEEEGL